MSLASIIAGELNTDNHEIVAAALSDTTTVLAQNIQAPPTQSESMMEMIVLRPSGDRGWSFHVANLAKANPLSPTTLAGVGAGVTTLSAGGAGFLAFLAAVTAMAIRPVNRAEAMTLALAHRLARPDGAIALADLINAAQQLRDEYGVVKNSATDIEHYFTELVRARCISESYRGFRVEERVWITPL